MKRPRDIVEAVHAVEILEVRTEMERRVVQHHMDRLRRWNADLEQAREAVEGFRQKAKSA